MFLTHNKYTEMGGTLDAYSFIDEERKAEAYINMLTHNRVKAEEPARESVKNAVFYLIRLQSAEQIAVSGITEKTNDEISVKYSDGDALQRQIADAKRRTVFEWLQGETVNIKGRVVPLLYAGVEFDGE